MKKILYVAAIILSLAYVAIYCANVSELVSMHTDEQLFIPIIVMLVSALLSVAVLIIIKVRHIDPKPVVIPLIFFAAGVVTLAVGYYTECPHCSL